MKRASRLSCVILVLAAIILSGAKYKDSSPVNKKVLKPSTTRTKVIKAAKKSVTAAGVKFSWGVEGNNLAGMLETKSTGWVAVGFGGDTMGSVGKVVIGSVAGGKATVQIQAISGRSHTLASGKLIGSGGKEVNGMTTITFKASLKDLGLDGMVGKSFPIILARNTETDDITAYHNGTRGSTTITLK